METFDVSENDAVYRRALHPVFLTGLLGGPIVVLIGVGAIYGGVSSHQLFIAGVGGFLIVLGAILGTVMWRGSRERLTRVEIDGAVLAFRMTASSDFLANGQAAGTRFELLDYRNFAGDPRRNVPFVFQAKGKTGGISIAAADAILKWARSNELRPTKDVRGQTIRFRFETAGPPPPK